MAKNAPWKKFSHQGGKFSLLMPGIPTETISTTDTVLGPLESHDFLLKAVQGNYKAGYLISYSDYNKEKRGILSDMEILEHIMQSIKENNKNRWLYDKKINLGKYKGIEIQHIGKVQKEYIITERHYLIDNRLLTTTAVMPKKQYDRGDAMKYLNSLKLTR